MRETGPVRVRLTGAAQQYLGQARTLLGQLKAEMAFTRRRQGWRRHTLADGVSIEVSSIHGQDEVRITVPERRPPVPVPVYPTFLSGVAHPETRLVIAYQDPDGNWVAACPWPIDPECVPTQPGVRYQFFFPSLAYARQAGLIQVWQSTHKLVSNGTQYLKPMFPGLFSGLMRALVQDHLSRGYRIPYSYTASKTHGVYTAGNGRRWLIEVSAQGVKAKPLIVHHVFKDELQAVKGLKGIVYRPTPPQGMTPLTLLEGQALFTQAVNGGKLFAECGWAFSASGRLIATTTKDYIDDYPGMPYGRLYILTIRENNAHEPVSVTCQLESGGLLYGTRKGHLKFPWYARYQLFSYDWFGGNLNRPTSGAVAAPMYAWYRGEELQVVRGYWQPVTNGVRKCITSPLHPSPVADIHQEDPDYTIEIKVDETAADECVSAANNHFYRVQRFQVNKYSSVYRNWYYEDVVVIPLYDRESIYHARYQQFILSSTIKRTHRTDKLVRLGVSGPFGYEGENIVLSPYNAEPSCNTVYKSPSGSYLLNEINGYSGSTGCYRGTGLTVPPESKNTGEQPTLNVYAITECSRWWCPSGSGTFTYSHWSEGAAEARTRLENGKPWEWTDWQSGDLGGVHQETAYLSGRFIPNPYTDYRTFYKYYGRLGGAPRRTLKSAPEPDGTVVTRETTQHINVSLMMPHKTVKLVDSSKDDAYQIMEAWNYFVDPFVNFGAQWAFVNTDAGNSGNALYSLDLNDPKRRQVDGKYPLDPKTTGPYVWWLGNP